MGGLGFICGLFNMLLKSSSDRKKRAAYLAAHGADTPESLSALADAYCKLAEARDAAQAEVNAKSATADALYASLTSNEQAILLEVRRFAPSAFEIAAADQRCAPVRCGERSWARRTRRQGRPPSAGIFCASSFPICRRRQRRLRPSSPQATGSSSPGSLKRSAPSGPPPLPPPSV